MYIKVFSDGIFALLIQFFALYATFLQVNQSEWLLGIVFASLRSFINKVTFCAMYRVL